MFKKILFITLGVIVFVMIALFILIKIYVKPENIRAFLIPQAEKALNRKVNLGKLNISLFKGIEVNDFAIKEQDGKTDFLRCQDFILKYKLLPLLSKKLIIEELKLVSPQIRVERDSEGKFNFEGIGQKKEIPEKEKQKQAKEIEGLPISLLVDSIKIENAVFTLLDRKNELPESKGAIDIDIRMESADESVLSSQGKIALKLEEIVFKKPPKKKIQNITSELQYNVKIDIKSKDISIQRADLKIQEIASSISGKLTSLADSPQIEIVFTLPDTKISDIQKTLVSFSDLKGLKTSGNITADVNITGMPQKIETIKTQGSIVIKDANINYQDIKTSLDGNLKLKGQSLNFDMQGTVGKNSAQLIGSVTSFLKNQKIKLNIYSDKLFLDELIPAGKVEKDADSAQKQKTAPKKAPSEAEPLDLKLTAEGEIKIKSTRYKGMTMSNFQTLYIFKNNRLEIKKLTANAGKGNLDLTSTVDLSKPGYVYNLVFNLDSLHADELVNSFLPKSKNTVFGTISASMKANGRGTLPENFKRNLSGNGNFTITDGKITGNKITENLALFLGIDELKTLQLTKAEGTVNINGGTAVLNSIFSSNDFEMDPSGNIGLLDETLNIAFDLKLSPRLADKALLNASIASYIKDEEGWGRIPLKVAGTFSKPSYRVDVEKAGKRVIKKKAKELIEDIFKKEKEQPQTDGDVQEKPEKDGKKPAEDLLKGIFK